MNKEIKLPELPETFKDAEGLDVFYKGDMKAYAKKAVELNMSEAKHRQQVEVDVVKELKALAQAVAEEPAATPRLVNAGRSAYRFLGRIVEKPASDDSKHLNNLLARIHRDGGHYQSTHGTDKAVVDADLIVAGLYASEDKPVAWLDEFGNTFPLGAYRINGRMSYEDAHKRKWRPLFPHPAPANQDAQDAARYRFLKNENVKFTGEGSGLYIGIETSDRPMGTWIGSDADSVLDAAIAGAKS